jgi:hypothetical protein
MRTLTREPNLDHARAHSEAPSSASPPDAGPARSLRRLQVFVDIVYALVAVHMLSYLPPVDDMSWVGKPLGLLGVFVANARELWRAVMGVGITAICWYIGSKRLIRLRGTDVVHTTMILVQTGLIYLFVYFAICDPTLTGGPSSRALQCASLALASAAGQLAWRYARRRGLVDVDTPTQQLADIELRGRAETATAVLNTPLSWVGPVSWTLGWLVIPLVITQALPRLIRRVARRA